MNPYESKDPLISIVMPVHNGMPFLPLAIESILCQTYANFEFIIGDDCSSDGSLDLIKYYAQKDKRIRVLASPNRLGPVASSNWVATHANADYVARMDADDLSRNDRLELQVRALTANPKAVLVGSLFETINSQGIRIKDIDLSGLCRHGKTSFAHSSILYRNSIFVKCGGYRNGTDYFEDADLYKRVCRYGDILVYTKSLVSVRASWAHHRLRDEGNLVQAQICKRFRELSNASNSMMDDQFAKLRALKSVIVLSLWADVRVWHFKDLLSTCSYKAQKESLFLIVFALASYVTPRVLKKLIKARNHYANWSVRSLVSKESLYKWSLDGVPSQINLLKSDKRQSN